MVGAAAGVSLQRPIRRTIYQDEKIWLILAMGTSGLLALMKLQASHYAFPGAAFLLLYAVVVFDRWITVCFPASKRLAPRLGIAVLAISLVSGLGTCPRPCCDFIECGPTPTSRACSELQALVRPHERAIFFDENLRLYWVSGRYPNWPILHTDVQTTYFVEMEFTRSASSAGGSPTGPRRVRPSAVDISPIRTLSIPTGEPLVPAGAGLPPGGRFHETR